jgi:hypothetical protein
MSEKVTELEALLGIDKLLSNLEAEEVNRIFDWISSKYKISSKKLGNIVSSSDVQSKKQLSDDLSTISIKEFIALKKPENYYERIACLAYYLEKNKGAENFKTSDITKINQEARLDKLPNPALYVSDATVSYGYLSSIGGGKKALSIRGEALVNALPDRDRVNDALSERPFKRRTKKSIKKIQ